MCGIVGYVTTDSNRHYNSKAKQDALADLIQVNSLRGADSTGFFAVDRKGDYDWTKNAVSGWQFVRHKPVLKLLDKFNLYNAIVFHNRYATVGEINPNTAHPFDIGRIVGVHNGTLFNYKELSEKSYKVDSEYMFDAMNKLGAVDALKKTHGAVATVFYDKKNLKLCLYHNEDRPLAFAKLQNDDAYFIASEKDMLLWVLNRREIRIEKIEDVPENTLWEIDIHDIRKIKTTEVKTWHYVPTPMTNYRGFNDWEKQEWLSANSSTDVVVPFNRRQPVNLTNSKSEPVQQLLLPKSTKEIVGDNYSPGDKIIVHITDLEARPRNWKGKGILLEGDFVPAIMQGISSEDAKLMEPYVTSQENKKSDGFIIPTKILSVVGKGDDKYVIVTPYMPIKCYANWKCQDNLWDKYTNGSKNEEIKDENPEEEPTPERLHRWVDGSYVSTDQLTNLLLRGCQVCTHPIASLNDAVEFYGDAAHAACAEGHYHC